mmetsp:Transcript_22274/g.54196  ORF Transcript_22274/g.54196 Transcript_22274/m.54196 type:complete len:334 (-) Transcript_22274:163-1164(-)
MSFKTGAAVEGGGGGGVAKDDGVCKTGAGGGGVEDGVSGAGVVATGTVTRRFVKRPEKPALAKTEGATLEESDLRSAESVGRGVATHSLVTELNQTWSSRFVTPARRRRESSSTTAGDTPMLMLTSFLGTAPPATENVSTSPAGSVSEATGVVEMSSGSTPTDTSTDSSKLLAGNTIPDTPSGAADSDSTVGATDVTTGGTGATLGDVEMDVLAALTVPERPILRRRSLVERPATGSVMPSDESTVRENVPTSRPPDGETVRSCIVLSHEAETAMAGETAERVRVLSDAPLKPGRETTREVPSGMASLTDTPRLIEVAAAAVRGSKPMEVVDK